MSKIVIDTYCGLSCKDCELRESCNCGGCVATEGKPFHGGCEVADCVKSKGHIRFCGECADFTCELLKRYSFDPEHGDNGGRIENCKALKAALVAEAREDVDVIAPCGFTCDYCPFGQWCGGCRSNYNCCSYATICEGGVCLNLACSGEKQLDGCYECVELTSCQKGFFATDEGKNAKASALFIAKHGKECFKAAIAKTLAAGEKPYDAADVEGILATLEKHI